VITLVKSRKTTETSNDLVTKHSDVMGNLDSSALG
jgi:hypothetical protein